ncbi:YggT family protein [Companilactobacillus bobalius]|uniref:YggT family protein n=1 Tax=Companilactobacillus bobalius TaxID=2801451 RepID=UPI001302C772|nr:YggT family protein [Companilactobacillus bobalius]
MDRIVSGLPFIISWAFELYEFILFVYCLMSFVPALYNSAFGRFVASMVNPFLNLIRRVIPTSIGLFDFSPIIAIILIRLLQKVIFVTLTLFIIKKRTWVVLIFILKKILKLIK